MNGSANVDRDLIGDWLAARSIARALPPPVADHGGWRVDTRSDAEWGRYVFATPDRAIADLARSVARPRVFMKLCAETDVLMQLLPERWRSDPIAWVMTAGEAPTERRLPPEYRATTQTVAGAIRVSIHSAQGVLAARGYAAEVQGIFVYDRIVTHADHRRKGLGSAVIANLRAQRQAATSREVLVATDAGRALYTRLGWRVAAPYATAVSPDPVP